MTIREMRELTQLTQKEFAEKFNIPIGTIRRWEYGESTPAPYILQMISRDLLLDTENMMKIEDKEGHIFYYEKQGAYLVDNKGTKIFINEDIDGVKKSNLAIYVSELFESYYEIIGRFEMDCRLDKSEDIIWS